MFYGSTWYVAALDLLGHLLVGDIGEIFIPMTSSPELT